MYTLPINVVYFPILSSNFAASFYLRGVGIPTDDLY